MPSCYKILFNLIVSRLTLFAEQIIGDYQCGPRVLAIRDGLKQGDALWRILFNIVLEYVVRQVHTNSASATLSDIIQIFGYADDLDLLEDYKETVVENAEILIAKAKDIVLEVSESKQNI